MYPSISSYAELAPSEYQSAAAINHKEIIKILNADKNSSIYKAACLRLAGLAVLNILHAQGSIISNGDVTQRQKVEALFRNLLIRPFQEVTTNIKERLNEITNNVETG